MSGWAISLVYGDGTPAAMPRKPPDTATTGPFRPAADAYGSCIALIPPGSSWALIRYGDDFDAVAADADPDVRVLPNLAYAHVLTAPERSAINRNLSDFAITGVTLTAGMTVRDAIRAIAAALDVTWNPEAQGIG